VHKAIIVFFTFSGNTERVAGVLRDTLVPKYHVDMVRLEALDEPASFLKQCVRAFRKKKAKIRSTTPLDVNGYDLICLGTPVWAFGMAPAMRAYISGCTGLTGKKIILFTTCGSGAGRQKCTDEIEHLLKNAGVSGVDTFSVQQGDIGKKEALSKRIKGVLGET
jgi:flavodoxin